MTLNNSSGNSVESSLHNNNSNNNNNNNNNNVSDEASIISSFVIEEEDLQPRLKPQEEPNQQTPPPVMPSPWYRVVLKRLASFHLWLAALNYVGTTSLGVLTAAAVSRFFLTRNDDKQYLSVAFRGTSSGSGCQEYYNETTGLLDRVRLSGSQDTATWKFSSKDEKDPLEFVVVSLKYCQLDQRTPSSFQVTLTNSQATKQDDKSSSVVVAKLIEARFDDPVCQQSCDCHNLEDYQTHEFGLTLPSYEEGTQPFDSIQLSPYLLEQPAIFFRDFNMRKYH